ncbi:MAG: gluzincin family metallopeptidase, partial [Planctomycetota bacterium]
DCCDYNNVHLEFMRWLGVESQRWDNASIEVSNDANTWTTIWENPTSTICDGRWVRASYDISAVAAGQPAVYIRWVMGPIDIYLNLPGWYIDDVKVVSILGPTNTVQTQADGSYVVTAAENPTTVGAELKGLYCDVDHECAPDARFELPDVYPPEVVDFVWDANWYNDLVESNVYWHINYVHDYFAALDPNLKDPSPVYPSGLDFPMPVMVKSGCLGGFCNAFTDGHSITFGGGTGSTCDDFGMYSEVAYHEYGHAVTVKVYEGVGFPYSGESGAMNEAWSDYFAHLLSPSQSPLIGDGGLLPHSPEGFRTLDNSYRRETDFSNNVHFDSQTVSGSLWQIRQTIGGQLDLEVWDQIVHFAKYAHPQSFEDYLLAILAEDDARYGDSFIANGTAHAQTIYTAFGEHGIGGLQYVAPSIVIDDSAGNADGKLDPGETANLWVSVTNGWADAANISATLTSTDPFVSLPKDRAGFGDLAHGGIADNGADPFVVTLDPACPQTHTINFALQVTADGPYDYSRTSLLTYPVAFRQLAYDDGQVDDLYVSIGQRGGSLAVRVTPESYPCRPMTVRLLHNSESDVIIDVTVWDDDGADGLPGTLLGTVPTKVRAVDGWFDADISSLGIVVDSGSFYAGWVEGQDRFYAGFDMDPPYYDRSWTRFAWDGGGTWFPLTGYGFLGNLMVRIRYFYTSADGPVENVTSGKKYDYIQYAIYDANDGDEIVAQAGTYHENINFLGKDVTVRSKDPNDPAVVAATVIHGGDRGPAVTFSSGEGQDCALRGFTTTGAHKGAVHNGAISCQDLGQTGPTISNCVIIDNNCPGIFAIDSSPSIFGCTIKA